MCVRFIRPIIHPVNAILYIIHPFQISYRQLTPIFSFPILTSPHLTSRHHIYLTSQSPQVVALSCQQTDHTLNLPEKMNRFVKRRGLGAGYNSRLRGYVGEGVDRGVASLLVRLTKTKEKNRYNAVWLDGWLVGWLVGFLSTHSINTPYQHHLSTPVNHPLITPLINHPY